ncbi:hypothetical protein TIFTF001_012479 [Ficus carica]|uniref:Uncharacterized protein n=1 Tax=Ficus carica TaxID=3494 RepID=A0AA88AG07_FICCA|nr:hypothetical protein TIFTF001_012479 [Ficus carica]
MRTMPLGSSARIGRQMALSVVLVHAFSNNTVSNDKNGNATLLMLAAWRIAALIIAPAFILIS